MSDKCAWHVKEKLNYMAWHIMSEELAAKGIKQIHCEICKHYFWPKEYGKKPKNL